ncbi:MAG: substrate-binding domain-containing protein [Anaerolineales bacterium]|nr:substrate-binding domain-containing protein [Anaerolineales bacterium]
MSTQTVSRVINARPDVSLETRKRVQSVIEEFGYQPSALARSLIRQRSYTLGVVTAGLKYIGPSRTLNGIADAAEELGYSLLLKELPRFDSNDVAPIFQMLHSRHVDGVIWAVPEVGSNRDFVDQLTLDSEVPVVFLAMEPRQNLMAVSIDNYAGARLAVAHLLDQGYRRIGHIAGPLDWWEARQRKAAWEESLLDAGLEAGTDTYVEGNWSSASGAEAIERLFHQYPEMDAVFVANDQMALSVMQAACKKGIDIPRELGVVGFDNIVESAYYWPPLTTIEQDQHALGQVAVEEVIRLIGFQWAAIAAPAPTPVVLSPTLVVRQSSVRPSP